jgi:PAS domain S-box-containing protein
MQESAGPPERELLEQLQRENASLRECIAGYPRVLETLKASEANFRRLFESAAVANCEVDAATDRIVRVNQRYCDLVGYSAAELTGGMTWLDLTHPDDRVHNVASAQPIKREQEAFFEVEKRYVRKDATIIWVHVAATLLNEFSGSPARVIAAVYDITKRKHAERALHNATQRLAATLESIADGLIVLDRDWRYTFCSATAAKLLAMPREDLLGACFWDLVRRAESTRFFAEFGRAVLTQQPVYFEDLYPAPVDKWFECHCYPSDEGLTVYFRDVSERRRHADARRATEDRYRLLADTMRQGVVHQNAQGEIIAMNPAAERILGWTREDSLGRTSTEFERTTIREDGSILPGAEHPAMRALATGEPQRGVVMGVFQERTADYAWIKVDAMPLVGPGEASPSEVYTIFEDITDKRSNEEARRRLTDELQTVLDAAPVPIWIVHDAAARHVTGNRCADEMLGVPHGANVTKFPAEDTPAVRYEVLRDGEPVPLDDLPARRAMRSGKVVTNQELTVITADGRQLSLLLGATPLVDGEGRVRGAVTAGSNITDKKRSEQELQRVFDVLHAEKERLSSVINSIEDEVWFTDVDGRVTLANPTAKREFGAIEGSSVRQLAAGLVVLRADGSPLPVEESAHLRALAGEPMRDEELVMMPRTREFRHRQVSAVPVRDASGKIIGVVSVVRDITERKRTEQSLREADRRKDEFLAMLAHELRNPLAPIRTAAEILGSPAIPPERLQWAQGVIQRQVKHMALLLDDLLDAARITQGKLTLKRERVTLESIIDAAVEAAQPLIDEKRHELVLNLPGEELLLVADPLRMAQVVSNLLTNAAKYTDAGGHIELAASADEGRLRLSVKDDGIGIAPDSLAHVFAMFSQVERGSERSAGGLGIGLALVQGIVELLSGRVAVASPGVGRGTEFTVVLPLVAAGPTDPESAPQPAAAPAAAPATATRPASRRVLVADDNQDAADTLAMILELAGHEVRVAHDGRAAFALAAEFRPEFALLDLGMPELSGYELARALRREPWGRDMQLIALTGWGQDGDRRRAEAAGFDRHITKPVDPGVIEGLLRGA